MNLKKTKGGKRVGAGAKHLPYKSKRVIIGVKEEYYLHFKSKWAKEVEEIGAGTRKKKLKAKT